LVKCSQRDILKSERLAHESSWQPVMTREGRAARGGIVHRGEVRNIRLVRLSPPDRGAGASDTGGRLLRHLDLAGTSGAAGLRGQSRPHSGHRPVERPHPRVCPRLLCKLQQALVASRPRTEDHPRGVRRRDPLLRRPRDPHRRDAHRQGDESAAVRGERARGRERSRPVSGERRSKDRYREYAPSRIRRLPAREHRFALARPLLRLFARLLYSPRPGAILSRWGIVFS